MHAKVAKLEKANHLLHVVAAEAGADQALLSEIVKDVVNVDDEKEGGEDEDDDNDDAVEDEEIIQPPEHQGLPQDVDKRIPDIS